MKFVFTNKAVLYIREFPNNDWQDVAQVTDLSGFLTEAFE